MILAVLAAALTFSKDVAPIIWSRCATCHRPGEIAPFSLLTYDEVLRRKTQIADVTARRVMPPWKPLPRSGDFQGARRLSDAELATIQQWISSGAAEGDPADLPPRPEWSSGWELGTPDVVVSMPSPFTVPAEGTDVFRTFVLPIPVSRPRFVRAIEFRPGNPRVVHHASMGIDRTRSSRLLDDRDPGPGYSGGMVSDARYPEGQLLGWTPGQAAQPNPPGLAWRLEPNSDLVVQVHMQPTGKPEPLQLSIGLFFTEEPPARNPVGLRLGSETIDIPAEAANYTITDRYVLPVDADLLAIQPHAHNLARRMDATAALPDGSSRPLIAIDDWDFRWQDVYRYAEPIALPKGTTITMRFTYDNSSANVRNPHRPPTRVVWGQNTSDEMGDLWLQLVPRRASDFAALSADVQRKRGEEDLAAYTKLLQLDPGNPLRHDAVGVIYLDGGRFDEAIAQFRQSIALNPQSAATHYNLAYALARRGDREEATRELQEAIRLDPDYAQAHNNLGAMLELAGRMDDAQRAFERAVALRPDNLEAANNLAQLLSRVGRLRAAADQFRRVLGLRDDDPQALSGLAFIEAAAEGTDLRDPVDAVRHAERAVAIVGRGDPGALDALAAAYAAAGRWSEAVDTANAGAQAAATRGQPAVAAQFRARAAMYQKRESLHIPSR